MITMKNILYLLTVVLLFACGESNTSNNTNALEPNDPPIKAALYNITQLEKETVGGSKPLQAFINYANNNANKLIEVNKDNIIDALKTAQEYDHIFIAVGNHTLVKITSLDDCKASRAWGTCMPKGNGYIKKGELVKQSDYINNIIGIPDNQKRVLYLFK